MNDGADLVNNYVFMFVGDMKLMYPRQDPESKKLSLLISWIWSVINQLSFNDFKSIHMPIGHHRLPCELKLDPTRMSASVLTVHS